MVGKLVVSSFFLVGFLLGLFFELFFPSSLDFFSDFSPILSGIFCWYFVGTI